ncbi:MAG: hypothetical protein GXP31_02340 [Kiritimatiellaeota bacterium]|nr:hypothetical protein [Kiritimatiellota bacterium]
MRHIRLLSGLALLVAPFCVALDMRELEVDHNVDSEFVTPHTAWAKPYALGQTRVLFFVNGRGANAREVVELKQRFDLDPQMVFWARLVDTRKDDWHGGADGIRRMTRLLGRKWDAFVFLEVQLQNVPVEQQYLLLNGVIQGAGLVLIGTDDKRVFKDDNRLAETPAFLHDVQGATAFKVRNGRGVRLPKRPTITYRPGWEVEYDEWDMRLGKAILWAAGKEPKLSLTLTPKSTELARDTLPRSAAILAWRGATPNTTAEVALRRDDGAVIAVNQRVLDKPGGTVDLDIPLVRMGKYVLDVIARDGKKVVGFGSVPFAVVGRRKVDEVALERDWAEIGQRLRGRVKLSGPPGAHERLVVSLLDRRDREVARQVVKPGAAEAAFAFDIHPWFPMLLEVRATLVNGAREVASAWRFAHVVKRRRGRFNFVMWDVPRGNLAPIAEESLARTGVTVQLGGVSPPTYVAAYDIAWIPYTTHIRAKRDGKGVMKPACWNDEAGIRAVVDRVVEKCLPARRHGVFVYSLGDEIAVRGSCLSPCCLDAYRRYLQEQYKDIAALNASWGSNYASFADVQLSTPDDNDETRALRAGNFPRWFDRQAYQSYNFCKLCERFGRGFRRIDPKSRCGFEGAGTFAHGDDLDGFVRYNGFWSPYPGTADEVLRSIAPRDFPRANWMGYTKDADSLLEKYWRMVTRGCDAVWWWRWEVLNRFHGWLSPCLDPYPAVREILRDTQIVRDGLGDLLLRSDMQTDGIGILYSQPSAYAAKVQTSPSFGSYESNHSAFHHAVRELGWNFRYFTDRQMRLGEVDLSTFKVIILPLTQAMSAQQAEMFRQYVRRGGVLVADVRPAIYNGHVKPLKAGQLDDVFGVRRTGFDKALNLDGQVKVALADGRLERLDLGKILVDGGVESAGASAAGTAGKAPLFLINSFGKGRAVLLNLAMSSFPSADSESAPNVAARVWRLILGRHWSSPAIELTDEKGRRLRNVEVTRWMNGPLQIVSVFRHKGRSEPARMKLPNAMYAYDLKMPKPLGKQREFLLSITPSRAIFFVLSPQRLDPVSLEVSPSVMPGGVQRVRISSRRPQGRRAVKVQVTLPDGATADWFDSIALVGGHSATVTVPVAFNDPKGTWTIRATELCTGRTKTVRFRVE